MTAKMAMATAKEFVVSSDAIAGTANNPTNVRPYTGDFSDPPTQAEMQAFAARSESLRQALIR